MNESALTERELEFLQNRADIGRSVIMNMALEPHKRRELPLFTASRAADMLDCSRHSVTRALQELEIGQQVKVGETHHYSLTQDDFIKLAKRFHVQDGERRPAVVVALINQKGGVAKTTTAIHLAHYCALLGYRTLAIDVDSQASMTAYMGVAPDVEINEEDTLFPILVGEHLDLRRLIRTAPHIKNLDFVPACLQLSVANELAFSRQMEIQVSERLGKKHGFIPQVDDFQFFNRVRKAIAEVRSDYDVIILDCPPHITASTYNVIYAADFALVPTSTSILDLASTLRFVDWVSEIRSSLPGLVLHRVKFLATNYDGGKASEEGLSLMRQILGDHLLKTPTLRSSEIQRAGALLRTIYEAQTFMGSREAWKRSCDSMDKVNREILDVIGDIWTVKQSAIRTRGT